jgi:hypothetical protein
MRWAKRGPHRGSTRTPPHPSGLDHVSRVARETSDRSVGNRGPRAYFLDRN